MKSSLGCIMMDYMETNNKNELSRYEWAVWKNCRLAGYVSAYGEWDALRKAKERFGEGLFVERVAGGRVEAKV